MYYQLPLYFGQSVFKFTFGCILFVLRCCRATSLLVTDKLPVIIFLWPVKIFIGTGSLGH